VTNQCIGPAIALAAVMAMLSLTPVAARRAQRGGADQARGAQSGCPDEPAKFRPCAIEKEKTFDPPRTSDGKPDLQGYWAPGIQAFDIEAHPETFDYRGEPTLVVDPPDGKVPYQPSALAKRNDRANHHTDPTTLEYVDPNARCFLRGVPRQMWIMQFQIVQPPGSANVAIFFEQNHAYRIIPMDGRPHLGENIRLWMQDSRGHWDGNTMVIDATNANGRTWLDNQGNFYSAAAHVVERITLVDHDTLHYEATIVDPTVFTRPWTMAYPVKRVRDKDFEIMEFACHEGNRSMDLQLHRK
jgi:hypothetical protein